MAHGLRRAPRRRSNLLNLLLDPLLIFGAGLGVAGAALATALSEFLSGGVYLVVLLRRRLASFALMLRPPSAASLLPLLQGAFAMLARQAALNVAFISATRAAQLMDPSGVQAAAYAISQQFWLLCGVALLVDLDAISGPCSRQDRRGGS